MSVSAVAEKLGGRRVLKRTVQSDLELAKMMRDACRRRRWSDLLSRDWISTMDLYRIVGSPRTLQRKRSAKGTLSPEESNRLARMARLITRAEEAFADPEQARRWLGRRALGGHRPIALLDSDAGAKTVERVLGRSEHGVVG